MARRRNRKTQQDIEEIHWPDYIGPKSDEMNYVEVDKILQEEQHVNVRDQLKGRVMEEAVWDPDKPNIEVS